MRKAIRFSDFRHLNEAEKSAALRALAVDARGLSDGELTLLEARIRNFEAQYEMTSAEMRVRIGEGHLAETKDVASWLIALGVRRRLRATEARP